MNNSFLGHVFCMSLLSQRAVVFYKLFFLSLTIFFCIKSKEEFLSWDHRPHHKTQDYKIHWGNQRTKNLHLAASRDWNQTTWTIKSGNFGYVSLCTAHLFLFCFAFAFEAGSLCGLKYCRTASWLVNKPQEFACLCLPNPGITDKRIPFPHPSLPNQALET